MQRGDTLDETQVKQNNPSKLFRRLYSVNLWAIAGVLILAIVGMSVNHPNIDFDGLLLGIVLVFIFLITPLLIPLFMLNVWGAIRYKRKRIIYIIVFIILIPVIYDGIMRILYMPLP